MYHPKPPRTGVPLTFLPPLLVTWGVIFANQDPIGSSQLFGDVNITLGYIGADRISRETMQNILAALIDLKIVYALRDGVYAVVQEAISLRGKDTWRLSLTALDHEEASSSWKNHKELSLREEDEEDSDIEDKELSLEEEEDSDIKDQEDSLIDKTPSSSPSPAQSEPQEKPARHTKAAIPTSKKSAAQALHDAGVMNYIRRQILSARPYLTGEDIVNLEAFLKLELKDKYTPGLLVYRLRKGERAPEGWINGNSPLQIQALYCPRCGEMGCRCSLDDEEDDE
jgi:hypothetical protein